MSKLGQIQALGIPWYREADYERLRSLFIDGDKLPRTFLQWQDKVEELRKRQVRQGMTVVKAYIDPDSFPAWCIANETSLDASGRMKFANAEAYRVIMDSQKNGNGRA
jgi:hypothetical protein